MVCEKRLKPFVMKSICKKDVLKVDGIIHRNMPRNCVVFLLLCELTWSAIYRSKKFDSNKWPTVLVNKVKGKACNFEACLCGSLFLLLKHLSTHAFYNERLQTLFKDQLGRSKAKCSFKCPTCYVHNQSCERTVHY